MHNKMISIVIAYTTLILLLISFSPQANASVYIVEEFYDILLNFDNPDNFSGDYINGSFYQTWQLPSQGDILYEDWPLPSNVDSVSLSGDANIGVSNIVYNPDTGKLTANITALTGLQGTTKINIITSNFGYEVGISEGYYYLQYTLSIDGGSSIVSPCSYQVALPGNWSVSGTSPGTHQLLYLNPFWTMDTDFTFDGINTIFKAHIDQYYDDGNHQSDLNFIIYGSAVPIPGALWLLGSGFLILIGFRKRTT